MCDKHFSSQSQKINFTQNNLVKSAITINDNKETLNRHKELASIDKETININEKTINDDDIQTNVSKYNCNEETVTNIDNNSTVYTIKLLQKTYWNTKN